jgi:hypothetical protein
MMTRKLKHYFLDHSIWVISDRLLARVLQSKEAIGWITQWVVEIGQYDAEFTPDGWSSLKHSRTSSPSGQIRVCEELMNYPIIGLCTLTDPTLSKEQGLVSCSPLPPKSDILKYAIHFEFLDTNNIVEYEGQVTGLRLAEYLGIR